MVLCEYCICIAFVHMRKIAVGYTDLMRSGASRVELVEHVTGGEMTAVTIRIPENLRDSAKECAALRGMSLSAFIRNCLISELSDEAE